MITRIKALKDFYGLSTRALAIKCGLNQPTLDRMLKGINALNLNCVSSILSAFPEVSAEWLMRGVGDMIITKEPDLNADRVLKMVDIISELKDAVKAKSDTIAALNERIRQLEVQLSSK